jgi:hypothetical protein
MLNKDVKKEDIIEICKRQTEKLIKYKKQEEFIEKVRKLYHKFYENKTEKVKLKTLWRWIKSVIRYISNQSKEIVCIKVFYFLTRITRTVKNYVTN